jgi:hypothetical protein
MSPFGSTRTSGNVRFPVAIGVKRTSADNRDLSLHAGVGIQRRRSGRIATMHQVHLVGNCRYMCRLRTAGRALPLQVSLKR